VAGQTIGKEGDLFLGLFQVTVQTPAHIHAPCWPSDGHLSDIPMTGLTTYARLQMWLMAEEDVVWHLDHPLPWDWLLAFPKSEHFLHFTSIGSDHPMASDAAFNRRNSGYIGSHGIGVTKQALNPSLVVEVVAKCNRLFGCGKGSTLRQENPRRHDDQHSDDGPEPPEASEA